MKLIILAMLVTTIAFASSNQTKIENTIKTVEQTYSVKCKFKKKIQWIHALGHHQH